MLYIYIYLLLSRPDSPVQIPRYIMLSMSCFIVLIPLIDRLRPLKCTKHQHCPKPRLYAFHLDPILIPGHSILICWMSSRKHLLILPTWVLAIMSLTCNTNINNFFPHPSRYHYHQKHPIFSTLHLVPGLLLVKLQVFQMPNQNLQNLPTFASSDPPFSGSLEDSPPREARDDSWFDSPYWQTWIFSKWVVGQVTQIWNSSWSELSHVSSEKKTTKQHRIAWWILKRLVVSCNAMQIDTHNRWVSTNCRGSRFQFMFLWHRQRSCMICSLNSMTPTRMNQRSSY